MAEEGRRRWETFLADRISLLDAEDAATLSSRFSAEVRALPVVRECKTHEWIKSKLPPPTTSARVVEVGLGGGAGIDRGSRGGGAGGGRQKTGGAGLGVPGLGGGGGASLSVSKMEKERERKRQQRKRRRLKEKDAKKKSAAAAAATEGSANGSASGADPADGSGAGGGSQSKPPLRLIVQSAATVIHVQGKNGACHDEDDDDTDGSGSIVSSDGECGEGGAFAVRRDTFNVGFTHGLPGAVSHHLPPPNPPSTLLAGLVV